MQKKCTKRHHSKAHHFFFSGHYFCLPKSDVLKLLSHLKNALLKHYHCMLRCRYSSVEYYGSPQRFVLWIAWGSLLLAVMSSRIALRYDVLSQLIMAHIMVVPCIGIRALHRGTSQGPTRPGPANSQSCPTRSPSTQARPGPDPAGAPLLR